MKRSVRMFALALCVLLLTALTPAYAIDNTVDRSFSMTAGAPAAFYTVDTLSGVSNLMLESKSGALFDNGMNGLVTTDGVQLYGSIAAAGVYTGTMVVSWTYEENALRYTYNITMTVSEPAPQPTPEPTPEPTPAPTPDPTPSPSPTPVPAPKITKDPTGETVGVNGSAMFIAHADNATERAWRFISADGQKTVYATSASTYFPGLVVSGGNTDTLSLSGIPLVLNGWKVACMFKGQGGETLSAGAALTVTEQPAQQPTITKQPQGAALKSGETCTLTVSASVSDGGKLTYQWYSSDRNSMDYIRAINGAETSSYKVPEKEGTVYYCVGVWNTLNKNSSSPTYSDLVAVTYGSTEPTPSPTPVPSPTPTPSAEHVHEFSENWSANLEGHWRSCTCGERTDEGPHEYEWTEVKAATKKEEGLRTGVCSICGYAVEQAIPVSGLQRSHLGGGQTALLILLAVAALAIIAAGVLVILKLTGKLGKK